MKKLIQIIGVISLMGISFFYTEKIINIVKEYDIIMIEIKNNLKKYQSNYENAVVKKDTIIPGISGYEIDINRSYSRMKRYGKYNDSLLVLKKKLPSISISNNKNKYIISGNTKKKNVSLIFLIRKDSDVTKIKNILDIKKIKGNFYMNSKYLEKNIDIINILIKEKHIVGSLDYDNYNWSRDIIKKIAKQKQYCYTEKKNKNLFKYCKDYIFMPTIIIKNNPYNNTRYIKNGSIISYEVNNELVKELPIIINYIKNKGYNIVSIADIIKE